LSAVSEASFTEVKARTEASDGNLSVHMRKLEEAGYVNVDKSFVGRRPRTTLKLTAKGRKAWIAYLDELRRLTGG
jgi:DNA-binding MarR family transcriptional regulator